MMIAGATSKPATETRGAREARRPADRAPEPSRKPLNRADASIGPDGRPDPYRLVLRCGTGSER